MERGVSFFLGREGGGFLFEMGEEVRLQEGVSLDFIFLAASRSEEDGDEEDGDEDEGGKDGKEEELLLLLPC
jgi:hypothetical protein